MESMTEENIIEGLKGCLAHLWSQGFALPLTFSIIAANGVICTGRFMGKWGDNGHSDIEIDLSHHSSETLQSPLHLLCVDAHGKAGGFVITPPDYYAVQWPSP